MGQRRIGCPAKYNEAVDHSSLDQFACEPGSRVLFHK
jgi:hypothetical protein